MRTLGSCWQRVLSPAGPTTRCPDHSSVTNEAHSSHVGREVWAGRPGAQDLPLPAVSDPAAFRGACGQHPGALSEARDRCVPGVCVTGPSVRAPETRLCFSTSAPRPLLLGSSFSVTADPTRHRSPREGHPSQVRRKPAFLQLRKQCFSRRSRGL